MTQYQLKPVMLTLAASLLTACSATESEQHVYTFDGFYSIGMQESHFEDCYGNHYWMMKTREYKTQNEELGNRNPVRVTGYIIPPKINDNEYSTLPEVIALEMEQRDTVCGM